MKTNKFIELQTKATVQSQLGYQNVGFLLEKMKENAYVNLHSTRDA